MMVKAWLQEKLSLTSICFTQQICRSSALPKQAFCKAFLTKSEEEVANSSQKCSRSLNA